MATSFSNQNSGSSSPGWASALGVVAIVLGVFLTAYHANEWMKNPVLINNMPASGEMPAADCPQGELEEEGISVAECEFMVTQVEGIVLSMPDWFPGTMMWLAFAGTILAFLSIIVGGALVNYKAWAVPAAIAVFAGLTAVDALQFAAVVNAGPIIRNMYLWHILLWILIHLLMLAGAMAGRDIEARS